MSAHISAAIIMLCQAVAISADDIANRPPAAQQPWLPSNLDPHTYTRQVEAMALAAQRTASCPNGGFAGSLPRGNEIGSGAYYLRMAQKATDLGDGSMAQTFRDAADVVKNNYPDGCPIIPESND